MGEECKHDLDKIGVYFARSYSLPPLLGPTTMSQSSLLLPHECHGEWFSRDHEFESLIKAARVVSAGHFSPKYTSHAAVTASVEGNESCRELVESEDDASLDVSVNHGLSLHIGGNTASWPIPAGKAINRKSKSLSFLCKKFLSCYSRERCPKDIRVDALSLKMNVERRRIYDIMNIFMAISIITKKEKNCYVWHGLDGLEKRVRALEEAGRAGKCVSKPDSSSSFRNVLDREVESFLTNGPDGVRKEKSLELMTQQFLVFLIKETTLSIEELAKTLIGSSEALTNNYNTKVRRLYDIANVLSTLKMVERKKIESQGGRKLAFTWLGVEGVRKILKSRHSTKEPGLQESAGARATSTGSDSGISQESPKIQLHSLREDLLRLISKHQDSWTAMLDPGFLMSVAKESANYGGIQRPQ